jgi:uncharacterized membrane protein (DUF485 family)
VFSSSTHWAAIAADLRFKQLHRDKNRFLWCMMLIVLLYFFCLPIASAYFQKVLKVKIWGVINVGLLFALSQFVLAWAIAMIYAKRANSQFDVRAKAIIADAHTIKGVL